MPVARELLPSASGRNSTQVLLRLALVALIAAALALFIDVEVARHCMLKKLPGDVHTVLAVSELFAHGAGVLFVGLTIWALDTRGGRRAVHVVTGAFSAGALAYFFKCLIGRWRPKRFDFDATVWESFTGWFPAWTNSDVSELTNRGMQSMPSGHTATAVAMACILIKVYPRGRWLFPFFAALVVCQRVVEGAHFVSDTLAATSLGMLTAILFVDRRILGWRLEERRPAERIRLVAIAEEQQYAGDLVLSARLSSVPSAEAAGLPESGVPDGKEEAS